MGTERLLQCGFEHYLDVSSGLPRYRLARLKMDVLELGDDRFIIEVGNVVQGVSWAGVLEWLRCKGLVPRPKPEGGPRPPVRRLGPVNTYNWLKNWRPR